MALVCQLLNAMPQALTVGYSSSREQFSESNYSNMIKTVSNYEKSDDVIVMSIQGANEAYLSSLNAFKPETEAERRLSELKAELEAVNEQIWGMEKKVKKSCTIKCRKESEYSMAVLLTGGTGYIGSHTAVELIGAKKEIILADDLSNSSADVAERIGRITGVQPKLYQINVADSAALERVFAENEIEAVIHFAGFKAVGESVEKPLAYYRNNLDTTLTILEMMQRHGCKRFVFSSSATVYGEAGDPPYAETARTGGCTNPYGWTKWMIEQILQDAAKADKELSVVLLRYFNPIGAHESGLIGEKPNGIPNNLMPYITQVAAGIRKHLNVFGSDYATPDGTGVRDYIHVVDLAKGHLAALDYAMAHTGAEAINLGTGVGYSVLDVVRAFEAANGVKIPYVLAPRRPGDVDAMYADPGKAERLLGWKAEKNLEDMCRDSWRWQKNCEK